MLVKLTQEGIFAINNSMFVVDGDLNDTLDLDDNIIFMLSMEQGVHFQEQSFIPPTPVEEVECLDEIFFWEPEEYEMEHFSFGQYYGSSAKFEEFFCTDLEDYGGIPISKFISEERYEILIK